MTVNLVFQNFKKWIWFYFVWEVKFKNYNKVKSWIEKINKEKIDFSIKTKVKKEKKNGKIELF